MVMVGVVGGDVGDVGVVVRIFGVKWQCLLSIPVVVVWRRCS